MVCKNLERWRTERIGINAPLLGSKSRLRLRPIEISALLVGQNVSGDRGPIALALAWCPVLQSQQSSFTGRQRRHNRHSHARGQASGRIHTALKRVDRLLKDLADILSLSAHALLFGHVHKLALTFPGCYNRQKYRQNTPAMWPSSRARLGGETR